MAEANQSTGWKRWAVCGVLAVCPIIGAGYFFTRSPVSGDANAREPDVTQEQSSVIHVDVTHPHKVVVERTATQPGSVQSFESIRLYAGVSGYLKTQSVDIGARVQKGQVLATVDVPELEKQVQRHKAAVDQARAHVLQMKARIDVAKADLDAAKATVPQAEATAKSKAAELRFREKQLNRMRELFATQSIDERLVDEKTEQRDAAREAEIAAREAVISAKARVTAMAAKIEQAEADAQAAAAEVKVAQAELEKAQVFVKFATIVAPFDGVVTERNFNPTDFVRAASEGGAHLPLLTVQRTDLMRVVVQIADRDVPYTDPGDPAIVEIDALPGQKFPAKVSRIADSEDPDTRLMHVEIDLPNPTGKTRKGMIRHGMYGRVTIILDKVEMLSLPSACLVGKSQEGKGNVYVVRDGHARLVPVQISTDNGVHVGILSGLRADAEVILNPASGIGDGTLVAVSDSEADALTTVDH